MSFLEDVERARAVLQRHRRVSVRALGRELGIAGEELDEVVEELTDIQEVARREGKALVWRDDGSPRAQLAGPAEHSLSPRAQSRAPSEDSLSPRAQSRGLPPNAADPSAPTAPPAGMTRSYTPRHLAEKILASRSAMEGELKQVTVLFCDVVDSMELAESLGAEHWHHTLDEFFRVLTSAVHAYEGTVNQYTGDGIMALFGAPIAAEDHARRACMAALEMQKNLDPLRERIRREHQREFAARIGIHSGEVVVGRIGDDLRMDYTAQGEVVGIAARLESLAPGNGILLSNRTRRQVEGYFELESIGPQPVKGVSEPLEVFRLGSARTETTRFDISRRRGLTRFVGRESDMAILNAALEQAQSGIGQVVGVVAEAGTGKSRLCYEFLERCKSKGMTVLQGHAVSHGKNIPFLPMLQVFRAYYGITERDDDRTAREKIAGRLVLLDDSFQDVLPIMFEFFGVADSEAEPVHIDPDSKQRQLFSVLRQIVQGADPEAGNIIAYIEDLHWLDAGSEAFLAQWVDAIAGSNSLLLVNFRPEYRADWMQRSYYRQLPLAPLSPEAVHEMLADLLGPEPSVAGLGDLIYERTGGNPFFCEEVVKSLQESGKLTGEHGGYVLSGKPEQLEIPASVHAVLAARIDRLSDEEKTTLQGAAVIGRVFAKSLLAQVLNLPESTLEFCLNVLENAEFIYQRSHGIETEYIFKHALTQEVALHSQLTEKRQQTHAAVARAIENLHGEKADMVAALIAWHWEAAGEPMNAAQWYLRAADHVGPTDILLAMRHLQAVLSLTHSLAESRQRTALRMPAIVGFVSRGAWRCSVERGELDALLAEMKQLADAVDDPAAYVVTKAMVGLTLGMNFGDVPAWGALADEAIEKLELLPAEWRGFVAGANRGYSLFIRGCLREVDDVNQEMIEFLDGDYEYGREVAGFSLLLNLNTVHCMTRGYLGHLRESVSVAMDWARLSRDRHIFEEWTWFLESAVVLFHLTGEGAVAGLGVELETMIQAAVSETGKRASALSRALLLHMQGGAALVRGDTQEAVRTYAALLEFSQVEHVYRESEALLRARYSDALLQAGDTSAAVAAARTGMERGDAQGARVFAAECRLALARALLAQGEDASLEEVPGILAAAEALIADTGARALLPQAVELRGRLAALVGNAEQAQAALRQALDLYREVGAEGHAQHLAVALHDDGSV